MLRTFNKRRERTSMMCNYVRRMFEIYVYTKLKKKFKTSTFFARKGFNIFGGRGNFSSLCFEKKNFFFFLKTKLNRGVCTWFR